jgi:hypothetical protein
MAKKKRCSIRITKAAKIRHAQRCFAKVRPHPGVRQILLKKLFVIFFYFVHWVLGRSGFPLRHFLTLEFLLPQATSQPIFFSGFIIRRWTRHCTPRRPLLGVCAGLFTKVAIPFASVPRPKQSEETVCECTDRDHQAMLMILDPLSTWYLLSIPVSLVLRTKSLD